jgi:hypothetical protein
MAKWGQCHKWRSVTCAALLLAGAAVPAAAQVAVPTAAVKPGTDVGIRGKFSLMGAYGFDLDVLGDVLQAGDGSLGDPPTQIVVIEQPVGYPSVYFSTPRRQLITAGFGVFQRRELIFQYSRTEYAAEPATVGEIGTASGVRKLTATATPYIDEAYTAGLRHYFKATGPARKYVNLLYGVRKIKPIGALITGGTEETDFGDLRLYDAASVPTAAIVFGLTYERGFVGIYIEAGAQWTQRLPRQDDDLRADKLEFINNTGSRLFMPANIGIVLRK